MSRIVLMLGPAPHAVSGVSTHLKQLMASALGERFTLLHYQVGSEGRVETRPIAWLRLVFDPWRFALRVMIVRPGIVHINTSLNFKAFWRDVAYLLVAKLLRRKVVYQVHGGALPQEFFRGRPLLTSLLRRVLRLPDSIVLLARSELRAYQAFIGAERVKLIPNAVEIPPAGVVKRRAPRDGRPFRITYLGRLIRSKGLFELIEAMSALRDYGYPFELVLAGDGPDYADLQWYCDLLHVREWVRFPPPVMGTAKSHLLSTSDVFVLPSHAEGLPYALLEAMAAGLPVVATAVGGIPDVVENEANGLLIAPNEPRQLTAALSSLLDDGELRARLGAAARERIVRSYSIERLVGDVGQLYDALCPPHTPPLACSPGR